MTTESERNPPKSAKIFSGGAEPPPNPPPAPRLRLGANDEKKKNHFKKFSKTDRKCPFKGPHGGGLAWALPRAKFETLFEMCLQHFQVKTKFHFGRF